MSARIRLDNISLSVPLYVQPERRASGWGSMLFGAAFDPPRRVYAQLLKDISLEANDGDRIAIVGRNGAGKSTLLRVLNGVYTPTSGQVELQGSCQALLNMSLGFNGEATVRENIFLRGTAMHLKAADLRDKIEPILEFSGLQEKASHRLRTLSSGQKMRLGFAISTSVQHEIILMDEWVGAGDSAFMAKATERMRSHMGGSSIVMLASHSIGLLRDICNKGIMIEQGRLVYAGDIISTLKHYHEFMAQLRRSDVEQQHAEEPAGYLVYGCAEQLELENGIVSLRGWLTSTDGSVPEGIALESAGVVYPAADILRNNRQDVMRHFGLRDPNCGFTASFRIPQLAALSDLGSHLRILAGPDSAHTHTPLRIAPAVTAAVRRES
jgi:lipopolysaccharide transport system ATP-binding protein